MTFLDVFWNVMYYVAGFGLLWFWVWGFVKLATPEKKRPEPVCARCLGSRVVAVPYWNEAGNMARRLSACPECGERRAGA